MRRHRMFVAAGALTALTAFAEPSSAQRGRRGGAPAGELTPPAEAQRNRVAMEQKLRTALGNVVRRQLKLDDRQMQSLAQVDRKYDMQRQLLQRDERGARMSLKAALDDTTGANDAKIPQYMDEMTQVMRKRVDLLEAEQKDLAGFLSPRQRAQYLALREQVNRRIQEGPGLGRGLGGGRRGPPPQP